MQSINHQRSQPHPRTSLCTSRREIRLKPRSSILLRPRTITRIRSTLPTSTSGTLHTRILSSRARACALAGWTLVCNSRGISTLPFSQVEESDEEGKGEKQNLLQEHRAPTTVFSVEALEQLQCIAACFPQEHLASAAQTQPPSRPQQVAGMAAVG